MRHFFRENPPDSIRKFVFLDGRALRAPAEAGETGKAGAEEKDMSASESRNVLLEAVGEKSYEHKKNLNENITDFLHVALKKNMRDWIRTGVLEATNSRAAEIGRLLPEPGKEPNDEDHVATLKLDNGQILFINMEGTELFRLDVTGVFRDQETLEVQYSIDRATAERIAKRSRMRAMKEQTNYLQAIYLATADLPGPRAKPGLPPAPTNPDEVEAAHRTLSSVEAIEDNRSQIIFNFEDSMNLKAGALDSFFGLRSNGYNLDVQLDPSIGSFNDDDWSAEGKWKDVAGRHELENLLREPPENSATVSYDAFLKAQEKAGGTWKKIHPDVLKEISRDFEKDWKFFSQKRESIEGAEKDPRRQKDLGFAWDQRDSVKAVAAMLDQYKAARERAVYNENPFLVHGWTVDHVRRAVQEGKNEKLSFDDVAEYLYEDNIDAVKKILKEKWKIPADLIDELGGDLKKDYAKFKNLEAKNRKDAGKHAKTRLVMEILGDYIVYGIRLVNNVSKLKYAPGGELQTKEARERDRNIFELSALDDGTTVRGKAVLSRIFLDRMKRPERYYTIGQDIINIFRGEDIDLLHGRIISMRDFNGQEYSLDGTWFTNSIEGEVGFARAFEAATYFRDGKEYLDQAKLQQNLKHYLQLGISVYKLRPGGSLADIMIRNKIERTIRQDDNIVTTREHFEKELNDYFDAFETYQRSHPRLTPALVDEFFDAHKFSDDLLEFVRAGAVVDYRAGGEAGKKLAERPKFLRYRYQFKGEDADKIIADLQKTGKYNNEELANIKENLTTGVVLAIHGDDVAFYGLGTSIALPHGYYLDIGFGKSRSDSLDFGVGAGKSFEVTEKLSVTLKAGAGVIGGYPGAGGGAIANYELDRVNLFAMVAGTTEGFWVAGGYEYRQDVLKDEKIEAKLLNAHINGPDGLSNYLPDQRYIVVSRNPEKYPEFEYVLQSLDALDIDDASKPIVFNAYYDLYVEELRKLGTQEAFYSHRMPIFRFLDYRGLAVGAGISTPGNMLNLFMPVKFGVDYRTLVFRLADVEGAETVSSRLSQQELLAKYQHPVAVEREIRFKGHVVVDKEGRLTMSTAKNAMFDIDPNRKFKAYKSKFETTLDTEVAQPDKNGLMRLNIRRAHGETRIAIDPSLKDKVTVVTDGDDVYFSVDRDQRVFVTREDLTYPFRNEGAVETTYLTVTGNPHIERRGPGSAEDRSEYSLWKRRGQRWRIEQNLNFRGARGTREGRQIMEKPDYEKWITAHPDLLRNRLSGETAARFKEAAEALLKNTSRETGEKFKLPEGFQSALDALKADKTFMTELQKLATKGHDFKERKVDGAWEENLPGLVEHIKGRLIISGIPAGDINDAAIDLAVNALIIESFSNIWHNPNVQDIWRKQLQNFEKPILVSIFNSYFKEQHPEWDDAKRSAKANEIALTIIVKMSSVDFVASPGMPLAPGTAFASLTGWRGITGIRKLYVSDKAPTEWGMAGNIEFRPEDKNEVQATVARFWINYLSNFPDLRDKNAFDELLVLPVGGRGQKIHEVLRQPLPLKLTRFAPTFMTAEELDKLANVYKDPPRAVSARSGNIEAVKKFLKFCQEVRDAQLAGKTEYAISETDYVLVLKTEVKMGVFRKCGNGSATLVEEFRLKEKSTENTLTVINNGTVISSQAGAARRDIGIFFSPSVVADIPTIRRGNGPSPASPKPEPGPEAKPQTRVLPTRR